MRFLFFFAIISSLALACGGQTVSADDDEGDSGVYGRGPDGGGSDGNGYVDPHCPDAHPPPTEMQCDVFKQDCPPIQGQPEACVPGVIPPDGPCMTEAYGSFCESAGTGGQGSACGDSKSSGCAAGFVCLITGSNTVCAKMCDLDTSNHGCPEGYECEPIDVPGFSACL